MARILIFAPKIALKWGGFRRVCVSQRNDEGLAVDNSYRPWNLILVKL